MPLPIYTYGNPGDATYSVSLDSLDSIMNTTPDNTINQITAKNIRDVNLTIYEYVANNLTQNLYEVSNNGNTTSNRLELGGLQVLGTSSFGTSSIYNELRLYSTLSDISGLTGISGYILSATNSGIQWVPNTGGTVPTLQQVITAGNTASSSYTMYGTGVFNSSNIFNGSSGGTWSVAFIKSIIINSTIQDTTGSTGTSGYILSATAGGVKWIPNTGGSVSTLQQVTNSGSTTSNRIQVGSLQVTGTSSFDGIQLAGKLTDKNGSTGTATYILQSKSGGVEWIANSGAVAKSLQEVTTTGNTSSYRIQVGGIQVNGTSSFATSSVYGNLILYSTLTDKAGLTGLSGYILSATSNGVLWVQNNLNNVTNIGSTTSNKIQVGGLQVNGTSSFVGTASFINGIIDNYGSTGSQYNLLSIDSSNKVKWAAAVPLLVNNVTTNYSLTASDMGKFIVVNSGSLVYITVPSTAFPIGASIDFVKYGAGAVTFTSSSGVIINSQSGYRSITTQYVATSLIQTSINTWVLLGNLSI